MPRNSNGNGKRAAKNKPPKKELLTPGTTVTVPIDFCYPDPNNENAHPPEQLKLLRYLYREFGQQDPAVCMPDGMLKSSHGWWQAMKEEGAKEIEVKVTTLEGWKADAYRISNNQSAKGSNFQLALLGTNVQAIQEHAAKAGVQFDPRMLAFFPHQLDPILNATWTPPPIDGSENDANKRTNGIPLSPANRLIIDTVIAKVRAEKNDPKLSEGDCIEFVCRAYLDEEGLTS